jgi:hypothetical protein
MTLGRERRVNVGSNEYRQYSSLGYQTLVT